MASVLVPVLYVLIVFGSLFIFSHYYRKSLAAKTPEPYFPSHSERDTYITLLQQTNPPANDALLKSALVRRAMADVNRVIRIREDKPALQALLQKGSIGDDLWNSLLAAEKEIEAEIIEVINEANSFVEGWGQVIFPTANEMLANEKMRASFEGVAKARDEAEVVYNTKALFPPSAVSVLVSTGGPPPPGHSAVPPNTSPAPPVNATLQRAANAGAESTPTSDAEGPSSPAKSAKKSKKRK